MIATVSSTAIRKDQDVGDKRPAWAALGRALGDDAATLIDEGADLLRMENDINDFCYAHDLGGNLRTSLMLDWDASTGVLTVTDYRSGDVETLYERDTGAGE